jgi:hypothetical protein
VPLSDHEQQLLEQMERALYAEDPKFASALEGSAARSRTRRRVYQSAAGFLVGVALLLGGLVADKLWLSVLGFLVMLACAVFAVASWRKPRLKVVDPRTGRPVSVKRGPAKRKPAKSGGFVDRMESRWQRRRDQQTGS